MWNKLLNLLGLGEDPELTRAKERTRADAADPKKAMLWGVLAVTYNADPAYMPGHSAMALRDWYSVNTPAELKERIADYYGPDASGYDLFRGVCLARYGQATNFLSEAESWRLALDGVRAIQTACRSWADYGESYLAGHLDYQRGNGASPEAIADRTARCRATMAALARTAWATPFDTPV